MNERDTTVFEIKVSGLDDFLKFIKTLKEANINLKNVQQAQNIAIASSKAAAAQSNLIATQAINNSKKAEAASKAEAQANKNRNDSLLAGTKIAKEAAYGNSALANSQANVAKQASVVALNQQRLTNAQIQGEIAQKKLNGSTGEFSSSLINLNRISNAVQAGIGLWGFGSFAKEVFDAQSAIEKFRLSTKNLIGATNEASLFSDVKKFILETPFRFENTIQETQQLIGSMKAVGQSGETIKKELIPTLTSLGNSAAGLGEDGRLGRLIYAFTQVQAAGRLMGTEVRQIAETGFPLLSVLSNKLGIDVAVLRERISDGKVSFDEFKKAILSAGQEGGIFAGQMTIVSKTVSGQIEKLKDSWFFAMERIGNSFKDEAIKIIGFASKIIYSFFGTQEAANRTIKIISTLVTTYAAAVVGSKLWAATLVAQKLVVELFNGTLIKNLAVQTLVSAATKEQTVLTAAQTAKQLANTTAQVAGMTTMQRLWVVMRANPLGILITVIGLATTAWQLFRKEQDSTFKEMKEALRPIREESAEFNRLAAAVLNTNKSMKDREIALEIMKNKFPAQVKGINDIKDAEYKLNPIIQQNNKDLKIRAGLLRAEFLIKKNKDKYEANLGDIDDAEETLKTITTNKNSFLGRFSNAVLNASAAEPQIKNRISNKKLENLNLDKQILSFQTYIENETKKIFFKDTPVPPPSYTNTDKPRKSGSKGEFVESDRLQNMRKTLAEMKELNQQDLQSELDILKKKKEVEDQFLREKFAKHKNLNDKLSDNQREYDVASAKAISKANSEINKEFIDNKEKANEEYNKLSKDLATAERELQEERKLQELNYFESIEDKYAKSEEEKLKVAIKYAKKRHLLQLQEFEKQINGSQFNIDLNNTIANENKTRFADTFDDAYSNFSPEEKIKRIKLYNDMVDAETKAANQKELINIKNYQEKIEKATSEHKKEIEAIEEKGNKKVTKIDKDAKRERLNAMIAFTKNTIVALDGLADAYEKFGDNTSKQNARFIRSTISNLTSIKNTFTQLRQDLKNTSDANEQFAMKMAAYGAAAQQFVSILGSNAMRQTQIELGEIDKRLKATEREYSEKARLRKEAEFKENNAIIAAADAKRNIELQRQAEQLSTLAGQNANVQQINAEAAAAELAFKALYNQSLNSKDLERKAEAERIVNEEIQKIREAQITKLADLVADKDAVTTIQNEKSNALVAIDQKEKADLFNTKTKFTEQELIDNYEFELKKWKIQKEAIDAEYKLQVQQLKTERALASIQIGVQMAILAAKLSVKFLNPVIGIATAAGAGIAVYALLNTLPAPPKAEYPPEPIRPFEKGIDNTSTVTKSTKNKADKKGGIFAIIHPEESIFSKNQMDKMTAANNGVRPTRQQIIDNFIGFREMNTSVTKMPSPYVMNKTTSTLNLEKEVKALRKDITKFSSIVANTPKVINSFDKSGYSTYLSSKTKKIKLKQDKFSHSI